jgi:hypothetical protein
MITGGSRKVNEVSNGIEDVATHLKIAPVNGNRFVT